MIEIVWRFDPDVETVERQPAGPAEAIQMLRDGNLTFAGLGAARGGDARHVVPVTADDLGLGADAHTAPAQAPFAALLGCADARVPLELVFSQSANDAFAVRVAGNVLGSECVGSLVYAVAHLPSIRLLGVVGHTGCGAVSAAVDAYLAPASYLEMSANLALRGIVDSIMAVVRSADDALRTRHGADVVARPGFRTALVDVAVVLNAAVTADATRRLFRSRLDDTLGVAFGVYDLTSRQVGLPAVGESADGWAAGMVAPPESEDFPRFVGDVVGSSYVEGLLSTEPSGHH